MVWMFVSLWDSYIKILMPNVMILAYMAFRRRLGYEGGGFMNEINTFGKEPKTKWEITIHKKVLTWPSYYSDLGLPASKIMRNKILLL